MDRLEANEELEEHKIYEWGKVFGNKIDIDDIQTNYSFPKKDFTINNMASKSSGVKEFPHKKLKRHYFSEGNISNMSESKMVPLKTFYISSHKKDSKSEELKEKVSLTMDRLLYGERKSVQTQTEINYLHESKCKEEQIGKMTLALKTDGTKGGGKRAIIDSTKETKDFETNDNVSPPKDLTAFSAISYDLEKPEKNDQVFNTQMKQDDIYLTEIKKEISIIKSSRKNIHEHGRNIENEVNSFIDAFIDAVQKHREILLSKVRDFVNIKDGELKSKEEDLKCLEKETQTAIHEKTSLKPGIDAPCDSEALDKKFRLTETQRKINFAKVGDNLVFVPEIPSSVIGGFQMFGCVMGEDCAPDQCILTAPETFSLGRRSFVILHINNSDGLPFDQPVGIKSCLQWENTTWSVKVQDIHGGKYLLWFTLHHRGIHTLYVNVNGKPIKDSPLHLTAHTKQKRSGELWNDEVLLKMKHDSIEDFNGSAFSDNSECDSDGQWRNRNERRMHSSKYGFDNMKGQYRHVTL